MIAKIKIGLPYFVRVSIGALFISAGVSKLLVIGTLANEIQQYQIVPTDWGLAVGIMVIAAEIILGGLLMASYKKELVIKGLSLLLVMFLLAKLSVVIRGIDMSQCNCFGTFLVLPLWTSLLLNGGLLGGLLYSVKGESKCLVVSAEPTKEI